MPLARWLRTGALPTSISWRAEPGTGAPFRCSSPAIDRRVGRLYLVTGRDEITPRRRTLQPREVWEALHAPDVAWLGDPELRRIAYQRDDATRTAGLFWIGESAKAALERGGPALSHLLAVPETSVPVHYAPWLRDADSLPSEESLRARVLSARGIAVAWAPYDAPGNRIEHEPRDPPDPPVLPPPPPP